MPVSSRIDHAVAVITALGLLLPHLAQAAAPGRESAPAGQPDQPQADDMDEVMLADGEVVRGRILARRPQILMAVGPSEERREMAWSQVAKINEGHHAAGEPATVANTPPPPPPPSVAAQWSEANTPPSSRLGDRAHDRGAEVSLETWWRERDGRLARFALGFGVGAGVAGATGVGLMVGASDRESGSMTVTSNVFYAAASAGVLGLIISGILLGQHRNHKGFFVPASRLLEPPY